MKKETYEKIAQFILFSQLVTIGLSFVVAFAVVFWKIWEIFVLPPESAAYIAYWNSLEKTVLEIWIPIYGAYFVASYVFIFYYEGVFRKKTAFS